MLMRALYLNVYRADRNEIASKLMSGGLKDDLQHSCSFLLESLTLVFACVWNFKYKYMRIPIMSL